VQIFADYECKSCVARLFYNLTELYVYFFNVYFDGRFFEIHYDIDSALTRITPFNFEGYYDTKESIYLYNIQLTPQNAIDKLPMILTFS